MGCTLRAVLLLFLLSQSLSTLTTAHNEDSMQNIRHQHETRHQSISAVDHLIKILLGLTTDMQKGQDNDNFILRMLSKFIDYINELTESGELNITESIGRWVFQNIDSAKDEFPIVAKNIEWVSKVFNNSLRDPTKLLNHWQSNVAQRKYVGSQSRQYKTICDAVDEIIKLSSKNLYKCCNVSMKPILSICRNIRMLLANTSDHVSSVVRILTHIHICSEMNYNHLEYAKRCADFFYSEITNLIESIEHNVRKILRLLRFKLLYSKCCISLAMIEQTQK